MVVQFLLAASVLPALEWSTWLSTRFNVIYKWFFHAKTRRQMLTLEDPPKMFISFPNCLRWTAPSKVHTIWE